MSSTESSGAPAEATATNPAPSAEFPTFGSTRGSGLARGKRPNPGHVAATAAASTEYTPTAIAVVSAPREYQNPFAPAETPAAVIPAPTAAPAPAAPVTIVDSEPVAPVAPEVKPEPIAATAPAVEENTQPAELNILPPEQPKTVPAQTWESEGFRPARDQRNDRPRREERVERAPRESAPREPAPREPAAPFDPASIPEKFLYVRPGYNYVPTPSNYGGAPRERDSAPAPFSQPAAMEASPVDAPKPSGGFIGWLKGLFGAAPAAPATTETRGEDFRRGDSRPGDRNRGRGRGQGGGQYASNGEGSHRRHRGGRGRNSRGGDYRAGGSESGGPAN